MPCADMTALLMLVRFARIWPCCRRATAQKLAKKASTFQEVKSTAWPWLVPVTKVTMHVYALYE